MLAYGRSKRTLRFSCQTSHLQLGLTAPEQRLSTPPGLLVGEDSASTPEPVLSSTLHQPPTAVACHSSSTPYYSAGTVAFPSRVRTGEDHRSGSGSGNLNSGGGHDGGGDGMYGHQQRPDGHAPARKRFRLDMDLGSDSDSSCEQHDEGGPALHSLSAGRGEFTNSGGQVAHSNDDRDVGYGSSGSGIRQRGSVGHGDCRTRMNNNTSGDLWQAEGGNTDGTWDPPGSVGYSSGSRGGERGRARQYLDEDQGESLSFVTPDHAGKLTVSRLLSRRTFYVVSISILSRVSFI